MFCIWSDYFGYIILLLDFKTSFDFFPWSHCVTWCPGDKVFYPKYFMELSPWSSCFIARFIWVFPTPLYTTVSVSVMKYSDVNALWNYRLGRHVSSLALCGCFQHHYVPLLVSRLWSIQSWLFYGAITLLTVFYCSPHLSIVNVNKHTLDFDYQHRAP